MILGFPTTVIVKPGDPVPVGAYSCPATAPGSTGRCDDCRACWDPTIPLIGYHEHGKAARRKTSILLTTDTQTKGGTKMRQLTTAPAGDQMEEILAPQATEAKAKHVSNPPAATGQLSLKEATDLDNRITEALAEDRRDELSRKLAIAPDVALMTTNRNFAVLGYKSKDVYFRSRHESKPYMLALEIVGKSDVEAIRALAEEYQLSWKRLQIYTTVENDPAKLVTFMETTIASAMTAKGKRRTVVDFQRYLKSIKHPDQPTGTAKAKKVPAPNMGEGIQVDPAAVMSVRPLEPTLEEIASRLECQLQELAASTSDEAASLLRINSLRLRLLTAFTNAMAAVERATRTKPAAVLVEAPVSPEDEDPLAGYFPGAEAM